MRIMSVDYGDSRTGLAVCDKSEIIASALMTVHEKDFDKCAEAVAEQARQNGAELVVVGNPINMNGTRGPRSEKCALFADKLRALLDVEVTMWDERSSTVTAAQTMNELNRRGKKRRDTIDAAAAAVILESYMAYRKNRNGQQL